MFAGSFFRGRLIRRTVSTIAALLAFVGAALVLVGSLGHSSVTGIFGILVCAAAIVGAWWIYRGGKALLFPRTRLSFAGLLTIGSGGVLYVLGSGVAAILVITGGLLAWLATLL